MTTSRPSLPILGFAAYSGTGKTTLLETLLPYLTQQGLRIGVLKHAHHDFDVDVPGKDSYRLRKAGASQMLVASRKRYALMTETIDAEAKFDDLLQRFDSPQLDLILVEGCKNVAFPKIELHRAALAKPWLYLNDHNIIAIAADETVDTSLPQMNINDIEAISQFILRYVDHYQPHSDLKPQKPSIAKANCDTLSPASLSVEQGLEKILAAVSSLSDVESIAVSESYGRVLAEPVFSPVNVPAYRNSAMDGYAIRNDDLQRDHYTQVAQVMAGYRYTSPLALGECVKIMTGAAMPDNADTVVMREQAVVESCSISFPHASIQAGQHVRQAGEDIALGSHVFSSGQRVQSAEMGLLASLGMTEVSVFRRLTVAIFSTGDEVQAPGSQATPDTIFDANRFTLIGLLTHLGCRVIDLGILDDDQTLMTHALEQAANQADVVITSGGVSVGDADFIKSALNTLGHIDFWRINMRPGRPFAFGHVSTRPFFGLPGNPVAVMVSFMQFVEPALRKMQGETDWQPLKIKAIASEELRSRQGRSEFSRGIYHIDDNGQLTVRTTGQQGSGILRSMSEANCLIEIEPAVDKVNIGESVTIIPLQGRI
ncbi:bifunctional molybdopterin-guanine dinucleotide biosynthesis adaptor protein MobB/molybdopterin molybdotransferase MoeA [Vibrio metschnikovii]|uniref:bifunctional molybdopterin-guanine dinucleotide biosynthesis adaptor protein MobB/molybdopterin molybdotransferase MoeA n=1 Tax=Vibrio metschnikovii TaxID=28172 RepID=UPI001C2F7BB6|nr:bifunctional molybdopterin-guanine dinucleotide biosynthesis adaptor protein MobB/molybdopterin molybdotransferase MoeA [Vibrio metschnikovii]